MNHFALALILPFSLIVTGCEAQVDRYPDPENVLSDRSHMILALSRNADEIKILEKNSALIHSGIHTLGGHPKWIDDWHICWDDGSYNDTRRILQSDSCHWNPIDVGRSWRKNGQGYAGIGWYRRSFRWQGNNVIAPALVLRSMEDSVAIYLNGTLIKRGGGNWVDVEVDLSIAHPGENTLHIRVVNSPTSGDPGRGGLSGFADISVVLESDRLSKTYDMIVLSSPLLLSWNSAHALREYVKLGGTVVAIFHDNAEKWRHLPIEEILPTHLGYPGEYKRNLVPIIKTDWLQDDSMDLTPVNVRPGMNLPGHPRFARPGTQNIEWWHPSGLAWNHEVLIHGNDGCETPILSRCDYGSGEVYACYSPEFLKSSDAHLIWERILHTTVERSESNTRPLAGIWSVGSVPWKKLELMGCEYTERHDADLVIIAETTDHALACLDSAINQGQRVLILDPDIFTRRPNLDPWHPEKNPFPSETVIESFLDDTGNARIVSIPVPDEYNGYTVFIENERYGSVRGAWFKKAVFPCVDGSWILTPSSDDVRMLHLGLWPNSNRNHGIIHWGNYGVLKTTSGVTLRQAVSRPFWRKPRERVIWEWDDGLPSVASLTYGSGQIIAPAIKIETQNPRHFSWNDVSRSKESYLMEDTEILIALLARELSAGTMLIPSCATNDKDTWSVTVPLNGSMHDCLIIRIRLMDWQRSLVFQKEYRISTTGKNTYTVSLPWPGNRDTYTGFPQGMEKFYWAEVMVLSADGDRCLGWIEQSIHPPRPRFQIWHTPVQQQTPPHVHATWPRFQEEGYPGGWGPASQYPLFSPGDTIDFFTETYGMDQKSQPVVKISNIDAGVSKQLKSGLRRSFASPWNIHTYQPFVAETPGMYLVETAADTFRSSARFFISDSSHGMRNVLWDRHKGVQVLGSLYPHVDNAEFTDENGIGDPERGIPWGMFKDTWPGQPWCNFHPNPHCLLPNGRHYRNYIASTIRDLSTHVWTGEQMVISASLVDGFNGVVWPPAAVHPQHLMVFTDWMFDMYGYEMPDLTVDSLATFVQNTLDPYWRRFVAEEISLKGHEIFRTELKKASPNSQVTDQCDLPQLPTLLRIPDIEKFALRWQRIFDISSMDAWNVRAGRTFRSSTYLGCLGKALAPTMRFGHFHMEMLGGDGPERISQLPRMYRQNGDLIWMSVVDTAGNWIPVLDYPNGGGVSWLGGWEHWLGVSSRGIRGGHTAFHEDYGGLMRLFALGEVLRPTTPRGFVLAAVGPRIPGIEEDPVIIGDQARLFSLLREGGLSISALARLDFLREDNLPDGIILPIPGMLSDKEKQVMSWLVEQEKPVGIVTCGLSDKEISSYTGLSTSVLGSSTVSTLKEGNPRGPFWDDGTVENHRDIQSFIESCIKSAAFSIHAQPGLSMYAFESTGELVVIIEENVGRSRDLRIPIRTSFHGRRADELLLDSRVEFQNTEDGMIIDTSIPASAALCIRITGI